MFKPESMSKITVIGTKEMMPLVIEEIHKLKAIHIIEHTKTDDLDICTPLEQANVLSEILIKIRSICSYLKIDLNKKIDQKMLEEYSKHRTDRMHHYKLGGTTKELYLKVVERLERIQEIDNKISEMSEFSKLLKILDPLHLSFDDYFGYRNLSVIIGALKDSSTDVKTAIKGVTRKFQLFEGIYGTQKIIAVFAEKDARTAVVEAISRNGFSEMQIPEKLKNFSGKPSAIIQQFVQEKQKLEIEKTKINGSLQKLSKKWSDFLVINEKILSREIEKAEAPLKFANSLKTFAVSGWVPEAKSGDIAEAVKKATKNKVYIEAKKPDKEEKENAPIKLANPKKVRDFEFFLDLYTLPKYKEIDPTFFIFLTFPFFFGFMLGDIGYGIVSLIAFLLLKRKIKSKLIDVLIFSSFITILFGFVFGEFFGEEAIFGIALPHLINRAHEINNLMIIAVAIGAIHINIGLIAGFINVYNLHGLKSAVMEKFSWIVLEAGAALTALSVLNKISLGVYGIYSGVALMALSAVMLYIAEGAKGIIELPSIFSNMLSYARLMAVGLASVILAVLVNESAKEFFHQGGFYIVAGILLLLVGHGINLLLGIIGPFLHSLRLHYVEFFLKFYEGGGKRYEPFGADKDENQ